MSQINPITRNPQEAKLFSKLISELDHLEHWQTLARFYGASNPEKARFLEQTAHAFFERKDHAALPSAGNLAGDWVAMTGSPMVQKLLDPDIDELPAKMLRLMRPMVRLKPVRCSDEDITLGASKFGGKPHLAPDTQWPQCEHGFLSFVAQINFADLTPFVISHTYPLPKSGLLVIFAMNDLNEGVQPGMEEYQDEPWESELTRAFYYPEGTHLEACMQPEAILADEDYIPHPCDLIMTEALGQPPDESDIPDSFCSDEEKQIFIDQYFAHDHEETFSHLMGWQTHGRSTNTAPGPDWLNLLTLASHEELEWCWCDGQNLDIYIHPDDMRARKFNRVFGEAS